ncbi:hypothetical protein HDU98_004592 [Podochytrium sp. JEL0797]|nr:hypothetical protein HDU98_004592 [Podochytrium sp. JEL0797]
MWLFERLRSPAPSLRTSSSSMTTSRSFANMKDALRDNPDISTSQPTSSSNLFFSKTHDAAQSLTSPIRRVFYINGERAETFPRINALVPEQLETKKSIIYAMGSLYTSLLPCLVVAGVGTLISQDFVEARARLGEEVIPIEHPSLGRRRSSAPARSAGPVRMVSVAVSAAIPEDESTTHSAMSSDAPEVDKSKWNRASLPRPSLERMERTKVKILLLNGTHDRETEGYTAMDFVLAITDVLNYSVIAQHGGGDMVTKVMNMRDARTDMEGAEGFWRLWNFPDDREGEDGFHEDEADDVLSEMESSNDRRYLVKPYPPRAYITHLLYAEDSQVAVEVERIELLGVRCLRVPKAGSLKMGNSVHSAGYFGEEELRSVLEPILM